MEIGPGNFFQGLFFKNLNLNNRRKNEIEDNNEKTTEATRQRGGKFRKQFSWKVVRQILVKILSDTIFGTLILFLLHLRGLPVE